MLLSDKNVLPNNHGQAKRLIHSAGFGSNPGLELREYVKFHNPVCQTAQHLSAKNFLENVDQADWPVNSQKIFIAFFVYGDNLCSLPGFGYFGPI